MSLTTMVQGNCLLLLALFCGCGSIGQPVVLAEAKSPARGLSALLVRQDSGGGAVGDTTYYLLLGQNRNQMDTTKAYFAADRSSEIELRWQDDNHLEIYYRDVHITKFKNHWYAGVDANTLPESYNKKLVELVLIRVASDEQWRNLIHDHR